MSVEIWPPIAPDQLKIEEDATQARELDWLVQSLHDTLKSLKSGLEDCYALLAPIDPGSTLVLSTPRNETVKGHVTRVGTRIVKGTINLKLRTLPPQTLTFAPESSTIHIPALTTLNTLLTQSIDLLSLCVSEVPTPTFLSTQLRLLSHHLAESQSLIKGTPDTLAPHRHPSAAPLSQPLQPVQTPATSDWTRASVPLSAFAPPFSRNLSFHLSVQDASLVLCLRALEPADAPLNFGAKLAFAIGTARRLEHDEADRVFSYCCGAGTHVEDARSPLGLGHGDSGRDSTSGASGSGPGGKGAAGEEREKGLGEGQEVEVFVREKVRVESADPSLLSMSAKLAAISNTLDLARRNLAAVMGEDMED
ncbi:37S ribosomal protein rsm22 [Xylariaceae sp. FL0016]|nr:37S ribosomal protein rsm22 [Xylariaceae sp. FL0016]